LEEQNMCLAYSRLNSHSPNNFLINQHVQVEEKSQKSNAILARKLLQWNRWNSIANHAKHGCYRL